MDHQLMLRQRAEKIESFLEKHLTDPDGIVYSMVSEETAEPFDSSGIPSHVCLKKTDDPAAQWNYEDSLMATAEYLLANISRHQVLQDQTSLDRCKRCFNAIRELAEAAAECRKGMVRPMFGFLPKPYGGLKNIRNDDEVSIDQYLKIMFSLLEYHRQTTDENERRWIESFLAACADCWDINHYTFNYFGNIVRWGITGRHAIAFGVFCAAVGEQYRAEPHRYWFEIFRGRLVEENRRTAEHLSDNCSSLILLAARFLLRHKPHDAELWRQYATDSYQAAKAEIDAKGCAWLFPFLYKYKQGEKVTPHWLSPEESGCSHEWEFLRWRGNLFRPCSIMAAASVDMFEITGDRQYIDRACELLLLLGKEGYLKHIIAASPKDLPPGYEIMGRMINGYNTAAWLRAYWQLMRNRQSNHSLYCAFDGGIPKCRR